MITTETKSVYLGDLVQMLDEGFGACVINIHYAGKELAVKDGTNYKINPEILDL